MDVSPNPASGPFRLHIQAQQPGPLQIRVLTITGELVFSKAIGNVPADYTEWVDPGNLAPGMYVVEVNGGQQAGVRKMVVK